MRKRGLTLLILFSVLSLSYSCSTEKTALQHLESAKNYLDQGNSTSAIIELKGAIQANPKNNEARYLLAKSYLSIQRGAYAEKELNKAIENGMKKSSLLKELLLAYFYQNKYQDLLSSIQNTESVNSYEKPMLFFYRGLVYYELNQYSHASSEFSRASNEHDTSPFSRLADAYLKLMTQKVDQSLSIATQIIETHKNVAEAYILAANLSFKTGNFENAIQYYSSATKIEPNRLSLYLDLSKSYFLSGDYKNSEKNIDFVLTVAPEHASSHLMKSLLQLKKKAWNETLVHTQKVLAANNSTRNAKIQAKLLSGIANFHLGRWETTRAHLLSIEGFLPDNDNAHRMLAYAEFELGETAIATDRLVSLELSSEKDSQLLTLLGSELARSGDITKATELFEKISEFDPDNTTALTNLGILQLRQDNPFGAATLEKSFNKTPDSLTTRYALAQHHITRGEFDEAIALANSLIEKAPLSVDGFLLASHVYTAQNAYAQAEKRLLEALEIDKEDTKLLLAASTLAQATKDFDKANNYLLNALAIEPYNNRALLNLYRLGKTQNDISQFTKKIKLALNNFPDNNEIRLVYALTLGDRKKFNEAVMLLQPIGPDSENYIGAQLMLGVLESRQNNLTTALIHYKNIVAYDPKHRKGQQALIGTYIALKQTGNALNALEDALSLFPNNMLFRLSEIELLFQTGQPQFADKKINYYKNKYGESAALELIQGRYLVEKGDYNSALPHLKLAQKLSPTSATAIKIAELLSKTGKMFEAKELLLAWLEFHPDDNQVTNYLQSQKSLTDTRADVLKLRKIIEHNPKNYSALNNLAWALGANGELASALKYAERAYKLAPELAPVLDTYGYLLLLSGDEEQALTKLADAYNISAESPAIAYHYALALKGNNQTADAKQILRKILNADFAEKEQAAALMKSLD